jgi:hypothetical protein
MNLEIITGKKMMKKRLKMKMKKRVVKMMKKILATSNHMICDLIGSNNKNISNSWNNQIIYGISSLVVMHLIK